MKVYTGDSLISNDVADITSNLKNINAKGKRGLVTGGAGFLGSWISETLPSDDPRRRRPDITKAEKILEWWPIVDLNNGLAKTVKWLSETKYLFQLQEGRRI
jgi:nucleoside-diphosphate-sugar epimerase